MRTLMIIGGGLVLLGIMLLAGRWLGGGNAAVVTAAKVFVPIWLAFAALNMWVGVSRAGYTVGEELPIFLIIFGIPAVAAGVVWWKLS